MTDIYTTKGYGNVDIGFGSSIAILVVDFQRGFVDPSFQLGGGPMMEGSSRRIGNKIGDCAPHTSRAPTYGRTLAPSVRANRQTRTVACTVPAAGQVLHPACRSGEPRVPGLMPCGGPLAPRPTSISAYSAEVEHGFRGS